MNMSDRIGSLGLGNSAAFDFNEVTEDSRIAFRPHQHLPLELVIMTARYAYLALGILLVGECRAQEEVQIDARAQTSAFPHFWEQMFGSGRAILTLRESY